MAYIGRFAPSPSGPLHLGSLVAALASFLDAKAHQGQWLLRIEDIDTPRVVPGADQIILSQLRALGLRWDGNIVWQSQRLAAYEQAFKQLAQRNLIYGCACTRKEIADSRRANLDTASAYLGTCRNGISDARTVRAWRFKTNATVISFVDRWYGLQTEDVSQTVGDFILKRADGLWAYQLAVVVDDAAQGITDIVRGADLLDSTARQHLLYETLGFPTPRMMHVPVLLDPKTGLKLSKQNHAPALDLSNPIQTLNQAWLALEFPQIKAKACNDFLNQAQQLWKVRFAIPS